MDRNVAVAGAMIFEKCARDALLPVLFVAAWTGSGFEWRGHAMQVAKVGESV